MSEEQAKTDNRARVTTDALRGFIQQGWAPRDETRPERSPAADYAAARRAALSAAYPGERLIVPAGGLKVRSNDCDYVFRPHTAFAYLTGLGADREPDAVLVLDPTDDGHEAILYFRPLAPRDSDEFFDDARFGEFWVGGRPTIEDIEAELGIAGRHIDEFLDQATKDASTTTVRVVRDADHALTSQLDARRVAEGSTQEVLEEADADLAHAISHARMVKDEHEVAQMRDAVAATQVGFEAVIADLRGGRRARPRRALGRGPLRPACPPPGQRGRLRLDLRLRRPRQHPALDQEHRRDRRGDLILLDAGVEVDSLYTADITRTLPSTAPSPRRNARSTTPCMPRRRPAWRPSARGEVLRHPRGGHPGHRRARPRVGAAPRGRSTSRQAWTPRPVSTTGAGWSTGPATTSASTSTTARWPRWEEYMDAELVPAWSSPSSRGSTSRPTTNSPPSASAASAVRIEDDVLVTETGYENLSAGMPRARQDVENWIASIREQR
jgi:Xaa-Pro aminopeptidase